MFIFLFSFSVVYLSGVSTCISLAMMDSLASKIFGFLLLPLYAFYPLRKFYVAAKQVKNNLGEKAGKYEEKFKKTRINAVKELHYNPLTGIERRD